MITTQTCSLLERYLPRFDFIERHEVRVAAPLARVWQAVHDLDLGPSRVVRLLFRLRGLPPDALRLDGLERLGFVALGERPERELAMGLAGRFWTPGGGLQHLDAAAFEAFEEPGFAKAVWGFQLTPDGEGSVRVATETRVLCLDAASCFKFRCYWLLVRPLSNWTRREALQAIRRRAEAG